MRSLDSVDWEFVSAFSVMLAAALYRLGYTIWLERKRRMNRHHRQSRHHHHHTSHSKRIFK